MSTREKTFREELANEIRFGWYMSRVPSDIWDDLTEGNKAPWMEAALRVLQNYSVVPKDWSEYVD